MPNLAELCVGIGISERSLHNYSRQFLAMAPQQYLRLRSLSILREAFRAGRILPHDLNAVARDYGFIDLRRLNAAYLAVFGEAPKATTEAGTSPR